MGKGRTTNVEVNAKKLQNLKFGLRPHSIPAYLQTLEHHFGGFAWSLLVVLSASFFESMNLVTKLKISSELPHKVHFNDWMISQAFKLAQCIVWYLACALDAVPQPCCQVANEILFVACQNRCTRDFHEIGTLGTLFRIIVDRCSSGRVGDAQWLRATLQWLWQQFAQTLFAKSPTIKEKNRWHVDYVIFPTKVARFEDRRL